MEHKEFVEKIIADAEKIAALKDKLFPPPPMPVENQPHATKPPEADPTAVSEFRSALSDLVSNAEAVEGGASGRKSAAQHQGQAQGQAEHKGRGKE